MVGAPEYIPGTKSPLFSLIQWRREHGFNLAE
jgi:hypothetical protein